MGASLGRARIGDGLSIGFIDQTKAIGVDPFVDHQLLDPGGPGSRDTGGLGRVAMAFDREPTDSRVVPENGRGCVQRDQVTRFEIAGLERDPGRHDDAQAHLNDGGRRGGRERSRRRLGGLGTATLDGRLGAGSVGDHRRR